MRKFNIWRHRLRLMTKILSSILLKSKDKSKQAKKGQEWEWEVVVDKPNRIKINNKLRKRRELSDLKR